MKHRARTALIAASFLSMVSSGAMANSACDKPHNDFDGLYCLNKVYQQSDADLNAAFAQLRAKLDPGARTSLRSGQLAWLRSRNESCSKHEDGAFLVNLACATDMTIARTQFLQSRYRECVSSGCIDSKIE